MRHLGSEGHEWVRSTPSDISAGSVGATLAVALSIPSISSMTPERISL